MDELLYLVSKLSKKLDDVDDIIESDEELIKITKIYDRLYDFLKESHAITTEEHKYRYNFVLSRYQFEKDYTNYEIFKSLIELSNLKGLYILDYPMIYEGMNGDSLHYRLKSEQLDTLDLLLSHYLTYFYNDDEEEAELSYITFHNKSLNNIIYEHFTEIKESEYVSDKEKRILKLFNELFNKADDKYFNPYCDDTIYIFSFFNIFYAYLVFNNKIEYEFDKIYNFLTDIDNSFTYFIEKIHNSDIELDKEKLSYMKTLYENGSKLSKKQIK